MTAHPHHRCQFPEMFLHEEEIGRRQGGRFDFRFGDHALTEPDHEVLRLFRAFGVGIGGWPRARQPMKTIAPLWNAR